MGASEGAASTPIWRGVRAQVAFGLGAGITNMLPHWRSLVFASDRDLYFAASLSAGDYFAALLWMALFSGGFFAAARAIARSGRGLAPWAMVGLTGLAALNGLDYLRISYFQKIYRELPLWAWVCIVLAVAAPALIAAWKGRLPAERIATACAISVAVFSPFALSTAGQGVLRGAALAFAPESAIEGSSAEGARPAGMRVAWIIFDELDRRKLTDPDAPYEYANFAALREGSIDFAAARPPGGRTLRAMPSYWIGQRVLDSKPRGAAALDLFFEEGGEATALSSSDTLFGALSERGARSGVVGFYHPYCRLFASQLERCTDYFILTLYYTQSGGFVESLLRAPMGFYPGWRGRVFVDVFRRNRASAIDMLSDPQLDFVMVHQNMPHPPVIYDAEAQKLQSRGARIEANFLLADLTLGAFVESMRASGVLERTALVVGADHGWGTVDGWDSDPGAIPLIVKLPGHGQGVVVDAPVDALSTRALILALLDGSVSTPAEVESLVVTMGDDAAAHSLQLSQRAKVQSLR